MLIPSIDLMNGNAVQLVGGKADKKEIDAGNPRPIAERFRMAGEIAVIDLDAALGTGSNRETIKDILPIARCRVGGGIRDIDTAIKWIDDGAVQVILGTAAKPEILQELPRERACAALDANHGEVVVKGWTEGTGTTIAERMKELQEYCGHFLVTFVEREGRMGGIDLDQVEELANIVKAGAGDTKLTVAGGVTTLDELAAIDAMGVDAQVGMAIYSGAMDFGEAVAAPVRMIQETLPTVVVDEHGVALGMGQSTAMTIAQAVTDGFARFAVEPRVELDGLPLINVAYDKPRMCVRMTVRTTRPVSVTDWGKGGANIVGGIPELARTLVDRMKNAPDGSYTKRLFNDAELLQAKLLEEAQELIDAGEPKEAAWEAADVIYFALVAATARGATLAEVEAELDRRSRKVTRRKGDAKVPLSSDKK